VGAHESNKLGRCESLGREIGYDGVRGVVGAWHLACWVGGARVDPAYLEGDGWAEGSRYTERYVGSVSAICLLDCLWGDLPVPSWMMSAVLTLYCVAIAPRVEQILIIWEFSARSVHSPARMMDPSHVPGKQSWKDTRMAARASSVAAPALSTNNAFRSVATFVQTVGQLDWRLVGMVVGSEDPAATPTSAEIKGIDRKCIVNVYADTSVERGYSCELSWRGKRWLEYTGEGNGNEVRRNQRSFLRKFSSGQEREKGRRMMLLTMRRDK
jgi:hypothetical protein